MPCEGCDSTDCYLCFAAALKRYEIELAEQFASEPEVDYQYQIGGTRS